MPNNNFKKQPKLRRVNTNLINTNIIKSNMSKFLWKKLQSSVVNAQKNYDKFVNQYNQDVKNSVESITSFLITLLLIKYLFIFEVFTYHKKLFAYCSSRFWF